MNPGQIAQQAQDPSHPANPQNPKVCSTAAPSSSFGPNAHHGTTLVVVSTDGAYEVPNFGERPADDLMMQHHAWVKSFASKLGNAATFGAGATMGGDLVNAIVK